MASGFMSREFEHRVYIYLVTTRAQLKPHEAIHWTDMPERMIRKTKKLAEGTEVEVLQQALSYQPHFDLTIGL